MLVCFGCSWPISILKSWRTKYVRGKSVGFMLLVVLGYLAGTASKLVRAAYAHEMPEYTTPLYLLNAILVVVDLLLYYKYRNNHHPTTKEAGCDITGMIDGE